MFWRVRNFGRTIFNLYDRHPLLMNSAAGATVYTLGEIVVEIQQSETVSLKSLDWKRVSQIGALGSVENGLLMLLWSVFFFYFNTLTLGEA